jgi:2-iminobutanoate/2-iminopropanoate deaminase
VSGRSYSRTRQAAGLVFVAGVLGRDDAGLVAGGPVSELAQALRNLNELLAAEGVDRGDVVRLVVCTTDLASSAELDAIFADHFPEPRPVRTTVGVAALPADARVEIEAIAALRPH